MSALSQLPQSPAALRSAIRNSAWAGPTTGLAPGHAQANIVILPAADASDFHRFCQKNPKPCPVLAISELGDPYLPSLGDDLDIRTDVPRYRIFRDGQLLVETGDIREYWRDDLVTFALGCSFSFEHALLENGIPIRHIEKNRNVPMFRTNIETRRAGRFHGEMVVTMRPMKAADAIRAIQVTSRFPGVHGSPIHIGRSDLIGISDLSRPDYGDAVEVLDDELPVFWACGVTPQVAVERAKPAFCITHAPGCMLVTDLRNDSLSVI